MYSVNPTSTKAKLLHKLHVPGRVALWGISSASHISILDISFPFINLDSQLRDTGGQRTVFDLYRYKPDQPMNALSQAIEEDK